MAKDVVFESEKYMQRQEAKRKWLPLAVLAALILLAVIIALFVRGSRGVVNQGGEDTPYPYSWSIDRKGVLNLEIDRSAAQQYTWAVSDFDISALEIERPEKQPEGVSGFLITPNAPGRYITVFSLVNTEDRSDCLYEWRFVMDSASEVDGENVSAGPLSVLSASGMELGGKKRNAEDEAVSYTVHADSDGNVTVEILNPLQDSFAAESASVVPQDPDEGDVVSGEMRGEEDGGLPPETPAPQESIVISDPAEIEELVGMPYDDWVALQKEEAAAAAEGTPVYDYNWTVTSDNENAAVPAGVFFTGGTAIASLNPGAEDGKAAVSVHNDMLGLEVYAELENRDGRLSVVSYGSRSYEPVLPELPEGAETLPEEPAEETQEP